MGASLNDVYENDSKHNIELLFLAFRDALLGSIFAGALRTSLVVDTSDTHAMLARVEARCLVREAYDAYRIGCGHIVQLTLFELFVHDLIDRVPASRLVYFFPEVVHDERAQGRKRYSTSFAGVHRAQHLCDDMTPRIWSLPQKLTAK